MLKRSLLAATFVGALMLAGFATTSSAQARGCGYGGYGGYGGYAPYFGHAPRAAFYGGYGGPAFHRGHGFHRGYAPYRRGFGRRGIRFSIGF